MNKLKQQMNEQVSYKILYILVLIIMIIPSILYIAKHKTILNFTEYFTFFLHRPITSLECIIGAVLFGIVFILLIYLYFKILKNSTKEFQNIKQVLIFVLLISIMFGIILPITSSDIFYYIGTGWLESNYHQNPYYTTSYEVRVENPNDEILQKTGTWENRIVVYGPLWSLICRFLSSMSFGSIDIALCLYKIVAIGIHIINTLIVFKITGRKKFALLYGINPFILIEMISNLHNDLYLIFFTLLALYFLLKKKNIILTIVFMAFATCVKYVSVLLIPFMVLYYLKNKKILQKILYCLLYAIIFISIVVLLYLMYAKDLEIFSTIFQMRGETRGTIYSILNRISIKTQIDFLHYGKIIFTTIFILVFIDALIYMFVKKKNNIRNTIRKYNNVILAFIFIFLTIIFPWYISWLISTIFWLKGKNIKKILYLQFAYELSIVTNIALCSDNWRISILNIPIILILMMVFIKIEKIKNKHILKMKGVENEK